MVAGLARVRTSSVCPIQRFQAALPWTAPNSTRIILGPLATGKGLPQKVQEVLADWEAPNQESASGDNRTIGRCGNLVLNLAHQIHAEATTPRPPQFVVRRAFNY